MHISVGDRRESLSRAVTSSRLLRLKKRWLTAQLGSFGDFGQQRKQTRRFREEEIQLWICEAVALGWEQWGEEERGGRKRGMKEKKERRGERAQPAAGPCLWCHRMDDRAKCTSCVLAAVFWPKATEKKKKSQWMATEECPIAARFHSSWLWGRWLLQQLCLQPWVPRLRPCPLCALGTVIRESSTHTRPQVLVPKQLVLVTKPSQFQLNSSSLPWFVSAGALRRLCLSAWPCAAGPTDSTLGLFNDSLKNGNMQTKWAMSSLNLNGEVNGCSLRDPTSPACPLLTTIQRQADSVSLN